MPSTYYHPDYNFEVTQKAHRGSGEVFDYFAYQTCNGS